MQNTCKITAVITPVVAAADHAAAPPGNQVLFTKTGGATGNCSLQPSALGTWATSDPVNTSISNASAGNATVTCVGATSTAATISNSGTVNGKPFTSATLSCR